MGKFIEQRLNTCFHVTASLNCTMDVLKTRLNLNNIKILSEEGVLRCEMFYEGSKEDACILEFSDKYISFVFFFDKPTQYFYNKNLIAFLSLIIYLKDFYKVNFTDLYTYIIEALDKNWDNLSKGHAQVGDKLKDQINILSDANCAISYELIKSFSENKEISKNLGLFREFSKEVINRLKDSGKVGRDGGILESLGMNPDLIKRVEETLIG